MNRPLATLSGLHGLNLGLPREKMKRINFWVTLLLVALTAACSAQDHGHDHHHRGSSGAGQTRTFGFSASDFMASDLSHSPQPVLASASIIGINSYLYIEGNLSANWTVTGWGSGVSIHRNFINIYHSDTLTLVFSGFANPTKIQGSVTGSQSVALSSELKIYNEEAWTNLFDTGLVPISSLNDIFAAGAQSFTPTATGGGMAIEFIRQIAVTADVGPGVYQNAGSITVTRN